MESDFTDLLAKLIRQAEPDLDCRLESQAQALSELKCTEPALGKWIEAHDTEYMLAAFELEDQDFSENFPGMAHFTKHDRKRIFQAFRHHLEACPRCQRKRSYDLEFDERVESVFRDKKDQLIHQLEQSNPEAQEEEHPKAPAGFAAHN
jgi:hypothetical protein